MPSRHLVDSALVDLLDLMPEDGIHADNLEERRANHAEITESKRVPLPSRVCQQELTIGGPSKSPALRVLTYRPREDRGKKPCILHIHGGGFISGSPESVEALDGLYSDQFGAFVVSVDYRLAPETPFPGSVEDCYAALAWIHENADEIGVNREQIIVTGESAGGGLAAALCLLTRDRDEYAIAFQHLIFPMLDDRTAARTDLSPYIGQYVWTPNSNHFGWSSLLGKEPGGPDVSPYAAPSRAEDLTGLPPTFMSCGALDLFLEEDMDYAKRLITAGVHCELHIYPGAPHGFMLLPDAQVSKTAMRDSLSALGRALIKS